MRKLFTLCLCVVLIGTSINVLAFSNTDRIPQTHAQTAKEQTISPKQSDLPQKEVTAKAGCSSGEIQQLLDENSNGEYDLTVVIPAGTYMMTAPLFVYSNTTIRATGAKLIKQSRYGAMIEAKLTGDDGGYDGNSNITIDGGTWDSAPTIDSYVGEGTETFRFIHCNNITVKNATLCNVPMGSHLIVFAGVQDGIIDNCKFYGYTTNWRTAKKPKEAVQLDMVHSVTEVPTYQDVFWDDLPCDRITIKNSEFYSYSRGIGSHTAVAGRQHTNIVIQNNSFHDLADSAIRLYSYKDTIVTGNIIDNATTGILAYTYIEAKNNDNAYLTPNDKKVGTLPDDYNISIKGNTIKNIKMQGNAWGDGIRIIGTKKLTLGGVRITGNTISSTARYGIFSTYTPHIIISDKNIISSTKKSGILAENSNKASIIGNTLKNMGIRISGSNGTTVSGNTINNAKEAAIYVLQSQNCKVGISNKDYNTIKAPQIQGIYMTTACHGGTIQYNKITNTKSDGIGVYSSANMTIKRNTLSSKQHGINVNTNSSSAKITGNTITAQKSGIWLTSNSKASTISNNTIKKYGATENFSGIYMYKSGGTNAKKTTKVTNNHIIGTNKRTQNPGIKFSECAYTLVQGNTITSAQGTGILIYQSPKCTISRNIITNAATGGISVNGSPQSSVSGNKIKGKK